MFARSRGILSPNKLYGMRALHNFNQPKISQAQLIRSIQASINQTPPRQPSFKTILQVSSIIIVSAVGTIGLYSAYQVSYKKQKTFIPLWINSLKRAPKPGEVDVQQVQDLAEEQLLERLSLDDQIKKIFRLPLNQDHSVEFELWVEEKTMTMKGLQISPDSPIFQFINKPIKIKKIFDQIMEPISGGALTGEPDFKIPVYNQHTNKEKDYDIVFLGTVPIQGKNGKTAQVVFKGIFDVEHFKHAKITKAHLIQKDENGKLTRKVLWE